MSIAIFILLLRDSTCFGHKYADLQDYATILLNYHICRFVLGLLCVGVWVKFGWGGVRFAGCRTTEASAGNPDSSLGEPHPNPQQTANQERNGQCGSSTI